MEGIEKGYPLIVVFYLDRELMSNPQIIEPYAKHVNNLIAEKEANMMTFFLPTDGEERVECINPIQIEPAKMDKIMKVIDNITENFFDIGQGADKGKDDPNNNIKINDDDK